MIIFKRINFLIALALIIFLIGKLTACKEDPFPKVILPVYSSAISITRMNDRPTKGAKAVAYNVTAEFPASKIIEFYNNELASMGYLPLNAEFQSRPLRKWSVFNSRSGEFEETKKPSGRYIAHWVDRSKKTWIWLAISYEYDGTNPSWETTAIVSCNMAKYSAYEEGVKITKIMKEKAHNKKSESRGQVYP